MTLRLYNTLTRRKEDFKPLDPSNVRMYVCGPTVYDFAHIGNARPVIVFDVLFRLLRHLHGPEHVTYIRNITDVDDKINARALQDHPDLPLNEAIRRVTEKTASQFHADVKALGCLEPTAQPRATEHIAGMIEMVQVLLDREFAYVAHGEDGREALFDVKAMGSEYGKLSRRSLAEQQAGARVAVEKHKRNPEDFVLWKESRENEPGWDAAFNLNEDNANELQLNSLTLNSRGRPGWHIECSAMSKAYLGEVFDIHGGGLDLIFPHHENEIAQSRCAHGTKVMANVWMHNGFLQVEGQKMSKSLGNFVTINEVLETNKFGGRVWDGAVLRFTMLKTHYRQPIDWTSDSLRESEQTLDEWSTLVLGASELSTLESAEGLHPRLPSTITDEVATLLGDDLNLNDTMVRLHQIAKQAKSQLTPATFQDARHNLWSACNFLGIDLDGYRNRMTSVLNKLAAAHDTKKIEELITARNAARVAKDWKESDRIRDELVAMGVTIKDNKDGTTSWEVKR